MTQSIRVFRNLPDLAKVSALLKKIGEHPNPLWAPENDNLKEISDRLSKRYFGITKADTNFDWCEYVDHEDRDKYYERWEQNFYFAEYAFDENENTDQFNELKIWEFLGWDVTDEMGDIHECLIYFQRQMICATKGLRGRLPDAEPTEAELEEQAECWAQNLTSGVRSRRRG